MPGLWRLGQGAWKGGSGNEADSRQNNRPHCSRGGRPPPSSGGHGPCPGGALPAAADAGSRAGEWAGPPSRSPPSPSPIGSTAKPPRPQKCPPAPAPLQRSLQSLRGPRGSRAGWGAQPEGSQARLPGLGTLASPPREGVTGG